MHSSGPALAWMMKRICATAVRAALPLLLVGIVLVGCGAQGMEPLAAEDPAIPVETLRDQAEARGQGVSRAARRFAPEMVRAGEFLLMQAKDAREAEARAHIAEADAYLRGAETVAAVAASKRVLQFPAGRSLGELFISPWGEPAWRTLGPAQGRVAIEAETMVSLQVNHGFADADFATLVDLGPGAIQYLMLGGVSVTVEGIEKLPQLVGLRDLSLAEARLDDQLFAHVAKCRALRHLNLLSNQLTDAGLHQIAGMPALEQLVLGDTPGMTDTALLVAGQLPRLRMLLIRGIPMTDVGVDYLRRAPGIERLWVCGRGVTDAAVPMLAELSELRELVLLTTSITGAGRRELQRALPKCKIDVLFG